MPVYPIKRVCRIKSDGTYKLRWCVLGNLDDYGGEVFAPTICKKILWLIFVVAVLLGLINQFFDIKGSCRNARVVTYMLLLMERSIGCFISCMVSRKWDQCCFVKWVSVCSFICEGRMAEWLRPASL